MPRSIREDEFEWLKPLVEWERERLQLSGLVNAAFPGEGEEADRERATAATQIIYWLDGRLLA
jgi:hypothetical protein